MRELRTKQGELTAAFKACVPPAWWGTDAGFKSQLGDRFKMCQVQIVTLLSSVTPSSADVQCSLRQGCLPCTITCGSVLLLSMCMTNCCQVHCMYFEASEQVDTPTPRHPAA